MRERGPIAVSPSPSRGENRPATPEQIASSAVTLEARWASARELLVHAQILETFHINAHDVPTGQTPTRLMIDGLSPDQITAIEYPPGKEHRFAFTPQPIHVYTGQITVLVRFKSDVSGQPLRIALAYQACNDNACFPPATRQIEIHRGDAERRAGTTDEHG